MDTALEILILAAILGLVVSGSYVIYQLATFVKDRFFHG